MSAPAGRAAPPAGRAAAARMWQDGLPPAARVPLLLLGMLALMTAIGGGLARLGWAVPDGMARLAGLHAVLMVGVFFTTVIGLERAVALARGWAYLGPLAAALGGVLLIAGAPLRVGQAAVLAGGAVLALAAVAAHRRQPMLHSRVMVTGALLGAVGSALWTAGLPVPSVVPWWLAFLVLTIAGERLELSRFLPTPALARKVFVGIVILLVGALVAGLWHPAAGQRGLGATLLALALWLARFDIARRTVSSRGPTRYIAVCLLTGYLWLAVAGLGALAGGLVAGSAWYDATIHALGLGFVFGMVLGHAPVIFPAVLRRPIVWSGWFYLPLAVLQGVLLLRVAGGLLEVWSWRAWGGAGSALAIATFLLTLIRGAIQGAKRGENRVANRGANQGGPG